VTGVGEREAAIVARMLVAAGRAALDQWCAGQISRTEAVGYATRGMTALLEMSGSGRVPLARAKAVR
jgi:hypothetical protein